jgi:uncharacterized protein (UPF0332 family)
MKLKECLEKGLLKENTEAKNWTNKELDEAARFLDSAEKALAAKLPDGAELMAYTSVFHSARALLYKKGRVEKSHICLFSAVSELYENENIEKLLDEASLMRQSRHALLYGGKTVERKEAEYCIGVAEELLEKTKKILKNNNSNGGKK